MSARPIRTGVLLAACAAVAFGLVTPLVAWAGRAADPLCTAALLYAGAAGAALVIRLFARRPEPAVRRSDAPRLIAIALVGGAIAPTLLAWGLQRSGATAGALLLNLEAVFTVGLARLFYKEHIGRRIVVAAAVMVLGGTVLVLGGTFAGGIGALGAIAVAGATLGWALDNTIGRALAERDPLQVIAIKGTLGAALTFAVALVRGGPWPSGGELAVLVASGATGYGASLYLYLLAQRRIGAARTGSVFALAPFIGAALAFALGDRHADGTVLAAGALFALGIYLHLTEHHHHPHAHTVLDHEHMHRHDDGHHTHTHDPPFSGEHSHAHHHDPVMHDHEHADDVHHGHVH
ncbi:MAG TPA: EamA family transporter [Kofleriaceae bacterium]|jgi:drug/metabolite transporter (DMT)-like permease